MTPNTEFPALVDPVDGQPLVPGPSGLSSAIRTYPVIDGIARLVPGTGTYADAFGDQWNRWQRTQLDSFTGVPISRHRLERCLGPALLGDLGDPGRVLDVCEAGCGAGRFTEVLMKLPGVRLTSIDLSTAVDANQRNCPQDRRHRIVQCDVCNPPFRADSFDVVVCLGVIQHTPSPEATIRCLYSLVRPGGWLVIDHYAPSWSHWTKLGSLSLRPVLKRLSPAARMRACEAMTSALLPIHKAACRNSIARAVVSRVSPLLTYYHTYPELADDHHREWAVLDTHDSLTDWYKHLRTPSQIRDTLAKLGADEISSVSGGNGVEARCRKPRSGR